MRRPILVRIGNQILYDFIVGFRLIDFLQHYINVSNGSVVNRHLMDFWGSHYINLLLRTSIKMELTLHFNTFLHSDAPPPKPSSIALVQKITSNFRCLRTLQLAYSLPCKYVFSYIIHSTHPSKPDVGQRRQSGSYPGLWR